MARKQAFDIFISIDGEAKALDTTSSREERQSRKRFYVFFFHSTGGTDTVVHRWPQTCHGFWATPGDGSSLEDPTISLSPQQAATRQPSRCEIQASPLRRVPWCREPAGLHAADGCQAVVVANHGWLGPGVLLEAALLVAQDSPSNPPSVLESRLQASTVHAVTRRRSGLSNIDMFAMQMLSI